MWATLVTAQIFRLYLPMYTCSEARCQLRIFHQLQISVFDLLDVRRDQPDHMMPGGCSDRREKIAWPSRSPYLHKLNFFSYVKNLVQHFEKKKYTAI